MVRIPAGSVALLVVVAVSCGTADDPVADAGTASSTSSPSASTSTSPTTTTTAAASVPPSSTEPEDAGGPVTLATTPDGRFTYSVSYREPFSEFSDSELRGVLQVDDGDGVGPALRDDRDTFDEIHSMTFGPDGLVTWTSNDYNKGAMVFIGRIDDGGQIVDTHRVGGRFGDVTQSGTFDDDGVLTTMTYGGDPYILDTASDPFFVMSADPVPVVETDAPLVEELETDGFHARADPGFWYRGATLGSDPACGSSTLYKDDADGYVRVLDRSIELDTVVDVDVAADFVSGGADSVGAARAVVISTACPEVHEGRLVHWGIEFIDYGDRGPRFESALFVVPAFDTPVAEVFGVRAVIVEEGGCCPQVSALEVDVELLDGTRTVLEITV